MNTMPTEKEYAQVKELVEVLAKYGFGQWSEDYPYYEWWRDWHDELTANWGFSFFEGCTKVVAVHTDCPWVIKVNMDPLETFSWSKNSYCEQEAQNWLKAMNKGMEKFFAATYFFQTINNVEYFIQECVECDENIYDSRCYNYYYSGTCHDDDEEECYHEDYYEMDDDERIFAIFGCGEEARQLVDFCSQLRINDLHCGNFGETSDGRTVIIDYSGY